MSGLVYTSVHMSLKNGLSRSRIFSVVLGATISRNALPSLRLQKFFETNVFVSVGGMIQVWNIVAVARPLYSVVLEGSLLTRVHRPPSKSRAPIASSFAFSSYAVSNYGCCAEPEHYTSRKIIPLELLRL